MGSLRRHLDPFFARSGISGAQWGILWNLYRAEQDGQPLLRVTDLGERLLIRPPSVTGVIDRLVRAGLVARTSSTGDHRVKLLELTPAGRELVETIALAEEAEILAALRLMLERMKVVVEPSSAVPLAALLNRPLGLAGKKVGVIVSGGNLDVSKLFGQP